MTRNLPLVSFQRRWLENTLKNMLKTSRCGDVDAGVLAFLERTEKLSASQSEEMLNKKSGLLGLSGVSSDMREVLKAADEGNHRALLALKAWLAGRTAG